jgi:RNA polymerase sigma-70 factor, ECF subfamily
LQTDWHIIIEACKKQDPAAQEKLYRLCYPVMIRICMRYAGSQPDIAGGIYNQAMLNVFRNIHQYESRGAVEAWIRRIVVNACIDHCRVETKFIPIDLNDSAAELFPIVPDAYNRIRGNEILRLIDELPKNTGLVFNLFAMEGYKHDEIAKLLGISAGTSKWHMSEARRLLKLKLETLFKKEQLANAI